MLYDIPQDNKDSLVLDKGKQCAMLATGGLEGLGGPRGLGGGAGGPGGPGGSAGGALGGVLPHFTSYLDMAVVTKLFDNVNKLESTKDYVHWR